MDDIGFIITEILMKKIKLNNPADQVWISLREVCPSLFKNKYDRSLGYRLSEGDIIKFGRVRFKVKAISTRKKKQAESKYDNNDASCDVSMNECLIRSIPKITESGKQEFNKLRSEAQCRICLGGYDDEESKENPLISPCKCSGTMEYIHLECLKQWLESKIHTKITEFTFSYNWKNLICELCGERFLDCYIVNGKLTYVLNYLRPEKGNYIILESYTNTPHKTIHVLLSDEVNNPNDYDVEYCVGRANEAAVRITDISVSRLHALITYSNNCFYVKDELAKFGTLVYLREPIVLPYKRNFFLNLQLGRFAISINCIKDKSIFDNEEDDNIDYGELYDEDAPYLPETLLNCIEQDSVKLGIKETALPFSDLRKLRKKNIEESAFNENDTNTVINHNALRTIELINTNRFEDNITQQNNESREYENSSGRHRNRDENSLQATNNNIQNMPLNYADERTGVSNNLATDINEETERFDRNRSSARVELQTDLGIYPNNLRTMVSPANQTTYSDREYSSSLRNQGGVLSRISMTNQTDIMNKKEKKENERVQKNSNENRRTRARALNLQLVEENKDDEDPMPIEERKSEQDDDDEDQYEWLQNHQSQDRILPFEDSDQLQEPDPLENIHYPSENGDENIDDHINSLIRDHNN